MLYKKVTLMTQVNFRIEDDVKANAKKAFKEMGLITLTVIIMFLVKIYREHSRT